MCLVETLRSGVQSRECVDDGVSLITWIFCSHFCFTFGMIDYRAGFLWWVYCEKFLVVLTDFRLEVHLLVWNASVTFLCLNRYSMRAIFCSLMLHSNIFSNECYRIIDIFGAIANYKNKTADATLVKPPGGSFPNQRFIESFNHGVIFNHLFLSSISFILPAMPSTKTFLVCLVFGFAVLIPFHEQLFGF